MGDGLSTWLEPYKDVKGTRIARPDTPGCTVSSFTACQSNKTGLLLG